MKNKFILIFLTLLILTSCVGTGSKGVFGTGVSIALDPRSLGTQIDDSIMQKNLTTKLTLQDKKYFLSNSVNLVIKFFCIIESSIWVPSDLGSRAILTPVPKTPFEPVPTQPLRINKIKKVNIRLFFIF